MLLSKGKRFAKEAEGFQSHALPDEVTLASVQIGMSTYLLSNLRLVKLALSGGPKESYPLTEIESFRFQQSRLNQLQFFITPTGQEEIKLGSIMDVGEAFQELFGQTHQRGATNTSLRIESRSAHAQRWADVPTNRKKDGLPKHLVKAIERNAKAGEDPVMIITGQYDSTDGSLIVFADRCVISKSGIIGSFYAASLGGGREATFFFRDITGIEYNSGMLTGVLEILTASYQGSSTKDFWAGLTNPSRNNSQNDPRVSSNTLPLPKADYLSAKPLIDTLRTMIHEAKQTTVVVTAPGTPMSIADEVGKLSDLVDKGLMTPEEFEAAKQRLLTG